MSIEDEIKIEMLGYRNMEEEVARLCGTEDCRNEEDKTSKQVSRRSWEQKLLEMVRQYPCLYDASDTSYRNAHRKEQAWREISALLRKPAAEIQGRFRNIRDTYRRLKKKSEKWEGALTSDGSMVGAEVSWPLFPFCGFLDTIKRSRPSFHISNVEPEVSTIMGSWVRETSTFQHSSTLLQSCSKTSKRQRTFTAEGDLTGAVETDSSFIRNATAKIGENTLFAMSVGKGLDRLSPKRAAYVKCQIMQLMLDAHDLVLP